MKNMALAIVLSSLCSWSGMAAAQDQWRPQVQVERNARDQNGGMSADQAARRAQEQYGGRVLAVRPEGPGYRVKLLKDGEVRTVYVGN